MHNDRIEIANPVEFHFGITPAKLMKPHESRPWNPLIANAFYRAGIIERWGSGTTNILNWCDENGNPNPHWQERAGSVVVTFLPIPESKTPQVTGEVTPEVTPEVRRLINALQGEMTRKELQKRLGLKDEKYFRVFYQQAGIASGLIEMTIPDKPRSSKQRYRLTEKGKRFLAGLIK